MTTFSTRMDVCLCGLVEKLCSCFLEKALSEQCKDDVLRSLSRPSRWRRWSEGQRSRVLKRMKCQVFERFILQKWKWFRYDDSPMSVECRILAFAYDVGAGEQVHSTITNLKECQLTEKEAILQFLLLVASDQGGWEDQSILNNSGVCMSEGRESLFESVPRLGDVDRLHSALTTSQLLFECIPGCGFCGWSSQLPLNEDKAPPPSSLFHGLTHTRIADINNPLDFPRLVPNKPVTMTTHLPSQSFQPPTTLSVTMESTCNVSELDPLFWCADKADSGSLLRQWEGWQSRSCYISEVPCFTDSARLALDRLTRSQFGDGYSADPSPPTPAAPGDLVHQLIWEMDHVPLHLINQPPNDGGSIVTALTSLLQLLLAYCRSQLTSLTDVYSSELMLYTEACHLLPLCMFVVQLACAVHNFPKGLDLVNRIYNQAIAAQSSHLYQLLLSILSYILQPYFKFVEKWVFLGQLDWGVEFGIHGNQEALTRRDEEYWSSGYVMASCCTPVFLHYHDRTLLTAGKALNLLKLCSPKHPLCVGHIKSVRLQLHFNADGLEGVHAECQRYSEEISKQINSRERERLMKLDAAKASARMKVEQRIEEAIRDAERIRKSEEASSAALKEKKQSLLRELQQQMETARAVKVEEAANEKKRDAEMMETLTQQEESWTAQVRSEMLTHYEKLTKGVELRQARAEWRVKRMNLQEKRRQFLQNEETRWREYSEAHAEDGSSSVQITNEHNYQSHTLTNDDPLSHHHDTLSHDLLSLEHIGEEIDDTTVFTESALDREQPPLSDEVATQQISDITSEELLSHEHQKPPVAVSQPRTPSAKELIYPKMEVNERGYPCIFSTRGQAPRSTVETIIYGIEEPHPHEVVSTRGHAPPSTIQHLLYPLHQATPTNLDKSGSHDYTFDDSADVEFGLSSQFIDHYNLLDKPPQRDMLLNVLGPMTSDPTLVDPLFLSLYPLDALLETSLALPIITQCELVNKALLDHFLTTCAIQTHFIAIKKFLLLEDGEFAHVLSNGLCEELTYGSSPLYLCSSSFLNPLLHLSLESCLHGHTPQAQRLAFRLKHRPSIIHSQAVDALEFLELKYEVDWPANIVITSSMLDKYNKMFHLLLQMRRASWALKTVFHHLRQRQGLGEHKTRQLQIYRHQFQHFVNIMHGYMSNQLFYISWREFEAELSTKVHSLDELIQAHRRFIDNAIFRCLLSKKAKPVMNIVQEVLSCILQFSSQSTMVSSATASNTYRAMCDTHRRFSNAAGLLMKVVSKLVARGYQPHLEDLLLRLNFNNFYGQ